MNILLLGGNSQRNKPWIASIASQLGSDFDTVITHNYKHWDDETEFIDFDTELARLAEEVSQLDEYVVFAKSVGSILTIKAIAQNILQPQACVFAGLPIKLAVDEKIDLPTLLKANIVPTAIIQNTDDPLAPYAGLIKYLEIVGSANYLGVETNGNGHSYDDLQQIQQIVRSVVHSVS